MILKASFTNKAFCFGAICLLSACADFFDNDRVVSDRAVPDIGQPALATSITNEETLTPAQVNDWDAALEPVAETVFSNTPIAPWSDVPSGNVVSYVGGLELVPDGNNEDRVFGTLSATSNFGTGEINATGSNFVHTESGDALTGDVTLTAEFLRSTNLANNFGINGALSGNLSGTGLNGDVAIDVAGDFADSGSVFYGGGTGTVGGANVDAAFVVSEF